MITSLDTSKKANFGKREQYKEQQQKCERKIRKLIGTGRCYRRRQKTSYLPLAGKNFYRLPPKMPCNLLNVASILSLVRTN